MKTEKQKEAAGQLEDAYLALRYVDRLIEEDSANELPLFDGARQDLKTAINLSFVTARRLDAPWARPRGG
jgi:hypothetical protein